MRTAPATLIEAKQKYERDGYVLFHNVLDSDLIQEARNHVEWLAKKHPELRPENYHNSLMKDDPFWVRLVGDDRLLDIAEQFIGPASQQPVLHWLLAGGTAWIALSEVGLEQGPVCMVSGSHRWADAEGGNFFDGNLEAVKQAFAPPTPEAWRETPMLMPPGAVSFHHKRTIHGSYPNTSAVERRSFAVHMCTENARLRPDAKPTPYVAHLDDPCHAPVIWEAKP